MLRQYQDRVIKVTVFLILAASLWVLFITPLLSRSLFPGHVTWSDDLTFRIVEVNPKHETLFQNGDVVVSLNDIPMRLSNNPHEILDVNNVLVDRKGELVELSIDGVEGYANLGQFVRDVLPLAIVITSFVVCGALIVISPRLRMGRWCGIGLMLFGINSIGHQAYYLGQTNVFVFATPLLALSGCGVLYAAF